MRQRQHAMPRRGLDGSEAEPAALKPGSHHAWHQKGKQTPSPIPEPKALGVVSKFCTFKARKHPSEVILS